MSYLPGAISRPELGAHCDNHPDRAAVVRVQGETDSFGAEYIHMCEGCKQAHDEHRQRLDGGLWVGLCGKCNAEAPLFPVRDFDEGTRGPVYYRCAPCRRAFEALAYAGLDDPRDD